VELELHGPLTIGIHMDKAVREADGRGERTSDERSRFVDGGVELTDVELEASSPADVADLLAATLAVHGWRLEQFGIWPCLRDLCGQPLTIPVGELRAYRFENGDNGMPLTEDEWHIRAAEGRMIDKGVLWVYPSLLPSGRDLTFAEVRYLFPTLRYHRSWDADF